MTTHAHRAPTHLFHRTDAGAAPTSRAEHAPEVLLALAAVLVVLAGPVARTVAPESAWVAAGSAALLLVALALAVDAVRHLLGRTGA